jgi:predicted acylesterase/phospholipase RssA
MWHLDIDAHALLPARTGDCQFRTMRALVLSGGGGFGAYRVGAWRALVESGWRPDVVLGTSIGAVNAFLISRGVEAEELRRIWTELPAEFATSSGGRRLYPYSREVPHKFSGFSVHKDDLHTNRAITATHLTPNLYILPHTMGAGLCHPLRFCLLQQAQPCVSSFAVSWI